MRNNKGITLIALTIMIIVLSIIASIGILYGKEQIQKAELESLKTNMLLIKAKTKEYVEQANFKAGANVNSSSQLMKERNNRTKG